MVIIAKNNLLKSAKNIARVALIVLIVVSLVACENQQESKGNEPELQDSMTSPNLLTPPPSDKDPNHAPLSQDIDALILENDIRLSIRQQGSVFVPASALFSQRILDILTIHGDAIPRVVDVDHHDLVLKFDGYKDIHLNFERNTFWFAGVDHLYPLYYDFADQWDRYVIRVVDGELMYDAFEKSIFSKKTYTDQHGMVHTATIFYDGDVRLSINNAQTVIVANATEQSSGYMDSVIPMPSYSIKTIGEQPLIAVISDFYTMRGPNANLHVFSYDDQGIQDVFSTLEMKCGLEAVDWENGEVTISLPYANATMTHALTKEEKEQTDERLQEFKDYEMKIDDEFLKMHSSLICSPIEIAFTDPDEDGIEQILISTNIRTIGATPLLVYTDVVFVFEVKDNLFRYKEE